MASLFLSENEARQSQLFALRKVGGVKETPLELQIQAAKLPAFVTEYQFAKAAMGRLWALDYANLEHKIAIEVEGGGFGNAIHLGPGSWTWKKDPRTGEKVRQELQAGSVVRLGGRHNSGAGMAGDCEKYNAAQIMGWIVVRVTPTMIRDGSAITAIEQAFAFRRKQRQT